MSAYAFGNYGHYRGDTLTELKEYAVNADRSRYYRLIHQLVDLIGRKAVDEWADRIELDSMNDLEAIREVEYKLDQFECYCTPVHDPCGGCQRLHETKGE